MLVDLEGVRSEAGRRVTLCGPCKCGEVHLEPVLRSMQTLPAVATSVFHGTCPWLGNFLSQGTSLSKSSHDQWLANSDCKGLVPTLNLLPSWLVQALFVTGCSWVFHSAAHFCRWIYQECSLVLMQPSTLISVSRELGKDGLEGDLERDDVSDLWWVQKTLTPEIDFFSSCRKT